MAYMTDQQRMQLEIKKLRKHLKDIYSFTAGTKTAYAAAALKKANEMLAKAITDTSEKTGIKKIPGSMEDLIDRIEETQVEIHEIGANLFYLERNGIRTDDIVYLRFKANKADAEESLEKLMEKRQLLLKKQGIKVTEKQLPA